MKHELNIEGLLYRQVLDDRPALTIGELSDVLWALEADPDYRVVFDHGMAVPKTFASFRGVYAWLSIGWEAGPLVNGPKLLDFKNQCKACIGSAYEGYKGGTYTMEYDTPLRVAQYNQSRNFGIVDVSVEEYENQVKLITRYLGDRVL